MAVLSRFAPSFFTGQAATTAEVPSRFDIAIDGVGYMLDWRQYDRRVIPSIAEQRDRSEREAGEQSLNQDGFFLRSRSNWDLGAGQEYVDRADSIEGRFWRSRGVDVWDGNKMCLLADAELERADAGSVIQRCITIGDRLYHVTASGVAFSTDPLAATPTWTAVTGITGTITGVSTDGNRLFIARSGSALLAHDVDDTTAAALGALTPDDVAYVNGRLIGWDGADLFEIDNSGAKAGGVNIWSHPRTGAKWKFAVSTPIGIFMACELTDPSAAESGRVVFYHVTADDVSTGLTTPTFAGELPVGEYIYALERYNTILCIGTNRGIRFAEYGNNNQQVGTLNIERSVRIYDTAGDVNAGDETPVRCFDGQGEELWFGWSGFETGATGLGRMNLARTVVADELVPPYASDLMADGENGDVLDVCTYAGKRIFCVAGSGLWREMDDRVASGWLELGLVSFDLPYAKTITSALYGTADDGAATSKGSVGVTLTAEDGEVRSVGPFNTSAAGTGTIPVNLTGRDVMWRVTVNRSSTDATVGPCVRNLSLEAFPLVSVSYRILVPVIAATDIKDRHGNVIKQRPLQMLERFDQLARGSRTVTYQELGRTEQARIRGVNVPVGAVAGVQRERDNEREWINTTLVLELYTRPTIEA